MNKWQYNHNTILIVFLSICPVWLLGEGLYNGLLVLILCILLIIKKSLIRIDIFSILFILFNILAIFYTLKGNNMLLSLEGYMSYLALFLSYMYFKSIEEKENILDIFCYMGSINCATYILVQGTILKERIYGNIGYSNTYALFLSILLYFNFLRKSSKERNLIELIFILGIIFTGSRNTLFYFLVYISLTTVYSFKNKSSKYYPVFNLFAAIGIYICFFTMGIGFIFIIIPIIFVLYCILYKNKYNKFIILSTVFISLTAFFRFNTTFIERLKIISLKNRVLQERFIYYEDALKSIIKNPFGFGINSFTYLQYSKQSAFYDTKYIHNSIIQYSYDLGVIGGILFLIIILYSFIGTGRKKWLNFIIVTLFLHSLLDFDFSYGIINVMYALLISFNTKKEKIYIKVNFKYGFIFLMIFALYFSIYESLFKIEEIYRKHGNYNKAIAILKMNDKLGPKTATLYGLLAENYNNMGNKESNLLNCERNLKIAEKLNPEDPRISINLAIIYEKMGRCEDSNKYYLYTLEKERYYYKLYGIYYRFLNKCYETIGNEFYLEAIKDLEKIYYNNLNKLNKKHIYLNDQMPKNFKKAILIK